MPLDPSRLAAWAKSEAHRLGFDLVGLTTPEPPDHIGVFARWVEAGCHGTMGYLATERALRLRAGPRLILGGCESILVAAMRYPPPQSPPPGQARIASYAGGLDYHDLLRARLAELVGRLEHAAGQTIAHAIYTDTGPILERELGQRAGLGWIGKNTCLIHPRLGSTFFLAEVFLALQLPADPPFVSNRCGTCTRCLDACPTGCILPDRTLDARRCISYLTIEHRGDLPSELRPRLGNWLFGCDICQEVCPWNRRFASPSDEPAFQPDAASVAANPLALLAASAADLRESLRGSPLLRPKRQGLLRNAAVVVANRGDRQAVPALAGHLAKETDPTVRGHLAWALGRLGGDAARQALAKARLGETDPAVLDEIDAALDPW
jgi:epoxyqueuosine reductase